MNFKQNFDCSLSLYISSLMLRVCTRLSNVHQWLTTIYCDLVPSYATCYSSNKDITLLKKKSKYRRVEMLSIFRNPPSLIPSTGNALIRYRNSFLREILIRFRWCSNSRFKFSLYLSSVLGTSNRFLQEIMKKASDSRDNTAKNKSR